MRRAALLHGGREVLVRQRHRLWTSRRAARVQQQRDVVLSRVASALQALAVAPSALIEQVNADGAVTDVDFSDWDVELLGRLDGTDPRARGVGRRPMVNEEQL